mmetsp:Transcript_104571/g.295888  ORF Transcript_104571/g.295888 Transcript_104571/m.295888 type:complete len:360 (-) Transcript_104571:86-1165(-)
MGNDASVPGSYKEPELPADVLEIRVSVYKLSISGMDVLDAIGAGILGTYHTGLVVAGDEWSYGGHNYEGKSGVYKIAPEMNSEYIFYQRIVMGQVVGTPQSMLDSIRRFATTPKWAGPCYDLLERNCNHFTSDLCWQLLKKRPPEWINSTANELARNQRRICAEHAALNEAVAAYQKQQLPEPSGESAPRRELSEIPGAVAFCDAFKSTFELAAKQGHERGQSLVEKTLLEGGQGVDPQAFKQSVEEGVLVAAEAAALAAAHAVGAAAREAAAARAAQPEANHAAWDAAWARESALLLRAWREAAAAGELGPDGELERARQVKDALLGAAELASSSKAGLARPFPAHANNGGKVHSAFL